MRQVCMEHINNCSVTLSNELSKLTTEREPTQTRWENIAKEIKFSSDEEIKYVSPSRHKRRKGVMG